MKKLISVFLCVLLLLGSFTVAIPEAKAVVGITYAFPKTAFVGETLIMNINITGFGPYEIVYDIYKDGVFQASSGIVSTTSWRHLAGSAGNYTCEITIKDLGFGDTRFFNDLPVIKVIPWVTPKITKVENVSGTALKVTWAAVPGAVKYELYRATSKVGPYRLVKATTATGLTNAYLSAGTQYFYKVRYQTALGSWSPLSNFITGVPVAKAAITSLTSPASRQVKLVWAKTAGASGYQVLLSTAPAGPYRVVRTLPGTTVTFSGLKSRSRFYF